MRVNRAVHIPYSNHATAAQRTAAPARRVPLGTGMAALLLVTEYVVVFKVASLLLGGVL